MRGWENHLVVVYRFLSLSAHVCAVNIKDLECSVAVAEHNGEVFPTLISKRVVSQKEELQTCVDGEIVCHECNC